MTVEKVNLNDKLAFFSGNYSAGFWRLSGVAS